MESSRLMRLMMRLIRLRTRVITRLITRTMMRCESAVKPGLSLRLRSGLLLAAGARRGGLAGNLRRRKFLRVPIAVPVILPIVLLLASTPARAGLTITATFDASLTAPEITVINQAIAFYQSTFADPINVKIYFKDMSSGLGQSSTTLYKLSYGTFIAALRAGAEATSTDDVLAISQLPNSTTNPVNGTTSINMKTANIRAVGINCPSCTPGNCSTCVPSGAYDGVIGINTSITDVDTPGGFSLLATVEHEMDEVLGLGSDLPGGGFFSDPAPEDLFRYASTSGIRSFSANASCVSPPQAFFSIDGTSHINEFHNCSDGADYGDWITHTPSQVQDAITNGSGSPFLTVTSTETRALDVIGYTLAVHRRGQLVSD